MTTCDSWLPHPSGHVLIAGSKELVHHVTGPACAFAGVEHSLKRFGGTLLLEPGGFARQLEPTEVARAQGGSEAHYEQEIQLLGRNAVHLHLAREPGWQYSAAVIAYIEASLRTADKAGTCTDPADEEAYAQLAVWLQAWKRTPQDPKSQLSLISRHAIRQPTTEEPTAHASTEVRCGGSAPKFTSLKHRDLVQPAFQDPSQSIELSMARDLLRDEVTRGLIDAIL